MAVCAAMRPKSSGVTSAFSISLSSMPERSRPISSPSSLSRSSERLDVDPMVTNFSPDMPQELPAASRAQMHKCGAEWQKMKQMGAAIDKTWLTFARICLAR